MSSSPKPSGKTAPATRTPPDSVALDPTDWYLAPWRNLPPLPRPDPRPFDLRETFGRLKEHGDGAYVEWGAFELPVALTREEAHFWLFAMTEKCVDSSQGLRSPTRIKDSFIAKGFDGRFPEKDVPKRLGAWYCFTPWLLIPLANLYGPAGAVRVLAQARAGPFKLFPVNDAPERDLAKAFGRWVLPYLTADERAEVRDAVRPRVSRDHWYEFEYQHNPDPAPRLEAYIAAQLGMAEEIEQVVASFPDGYLRWYWKHPVRAEHASLLVFGLPDPAEQMRQMRRLDAPIDNPYLVRAWLANTELADLEYVRDAILRAKNRADAQALVEALGLARAPEVVAAMLALQQSPRAAPAALKWFRGNRALASRGLKRIAAGKSALAAAATEVLGKLGT